MSSSSTEEFLPSASAGGSLLSRGINRPLLPIKSYYFFIMAAIGILFPFITLYMQQLGLSSTETGIIYCIIAFIGSFIRPVSGALADKFRSHKLVLITTTVATGLLFLLLMAVPKRASPRAMSVITNLRCNNQDSFLQECSNLYHDNCHKGLSHLENMSSSEKESNNTRSTKCSFVCTAEQSLEMCYTNSTVAFYGRKCDGVLKTAKKMEFTIDDIQTVLDATVALHAPDNCTLYDLKGVWYEGDAWQILCSEAVDLKCIVDCGAEKEECEDTSQSYDQTFFLYFLVFLVANLAIFPIFPILDAVTYDILGKHRHKWGQQRLWGTLGFAAFAVTSTFVMQYLSQDSEDVNYSYCFYIFGILCLVSAWQAHFIQASSQVKCGRVINNVRNLLSHSEVTVFLLVVMYFGVMQGGIEAFLFWFLKDGHSPLGARIAQCGRVISNVWRLLSHPEVTVFLLVVMYFGVMQGGIEAFVFWFLKDLDSHPLVFGLMLVISCTVEVPMFWIANAVINKIGLMPCLYLALVCFSGRLLTYSFLVDPWVILAVEPVHAVTYALMYSAAASYASVRAPPGMSATLQGLLDGVLYGIGKGVGSLVTGVMFEGLGARWTWRLFSVLSIVVLIIYFLLNTFVFKPTLQTGGSSSPSTQDGVGKSSSEEGTDIDQEDQAQSKDTTNEKEPHILECSTL